MTFSCEKCSAGHRPQTCTHLSRKQFELKQKGRPQTQCGNCRESRRNTKQSSTHHQCLCGSTPTKKQKVEFILNQHLSFTFKQTMTAIQSIQKSIESQSNNCLVTLKRKDLKTKLESTEDLKYTLEKVLILEQDETSLEETERMIVNPCRCHSGDPCICSSLPAKPSKKLIRDHSMYTKITNQILLNLENEKQNDSFDKGDLFMDSCQQNKTKSLISISAAQNKCCSSEKEQNIKRVSSSCCSIKSNELQSSLTSCCNSSIASDTSTTNPTQSCNSKTRAPIEPFKSNAYILSTSSSCCSPNTTTLFSPQNNEKSCGFDVANKSVMEENVFAEKKIEDGCCCSTKTNGTKEAVSCGCGCSLKDENCGKNDCIDTICDAGLEQFLKV